MFKAYISRIYFTLSNHNKDQTQNDINTLLGNMATPTDREMHQKYQDPSYHISSSLKNLRECLWNFANNMERISKEAHEHGVDLFIDL